MKISRRTIMAAACLMVAVALFFLPSLLPLRPLLAAVLGHGQNPLPGTLAVRTCSLGWFEGLDCVDLRYDDPARGIGLRAPKLTTDKGLLLLLLAPSYLGEVRLDQPAVSVHVLPSANRPDPAPPPVTVDRQPLPAGTGGGGEKPWWNQRTVRLQVGKAKVLLEDGQGPEREIARDLELNASLAMGTLEYALEFRNAPDQGSLRAKGFVNLPVRGQPLPETLISRGEVEIRHLEIADFLDLAASRFNLPRGRGLLSASVFFHFAGIEEMELRGETALERVQLAGGFLGRDRPELDRISLNFKGSRRPAQGWRLSVLELASDPVRFTASGTYDQATAAFSARGDADLPALAAQVPHLLALHEKTVFRQGAARFSLQVAGRPQQFTVSVDCRTDRLQLEHDGRPYAWDTPLVLAAEAEVDQGAVTVRSLTAQAPFFDLGGGGAADDFVLRATADLERMSQELERIFLLDLHAQGQAKLFAAAKRQSDGRYRLESRLGIAGFSLERGRKPLFPGHDFLLAAQALGAPSFFSDYRLHGLKLEGRSWPATLLLEARDLEQEADPGQANCTLRATGDLERISALYPPLVEAALPYPLKGQLFLDLAGNWADGRFSALSAQGRVEQLTISHGGAAVHEPRLVFGLDPSSLPQSATIALRGLRVAKDWQDVPQHEPSTLMFTPGQRQLDLRRLFFRGTKTNGMVSLKAQGWRQAEAETGIELSGSSEAGFLADLLRLQGWLPAGTTLQGQARVAVKAVSGGGHDQVEAEVTVAPFAWLQGKKKVFADPRLHLAFTLLPDPAGAGAHPLPAFVLETVPLALSASGLIQGKATPILELQGRMTPDFKALMPLLRPLFGRRVSLAGREEGTFLLAAPLRWPLDPLQATFAAQLPVQSLRYRSLQLAPLTVPVDLNRGRLNLEIASGLDSGELNFRPQWDLADPQPLMTLPPSSQVLRGVELKPPLLDSLLTALHPLFGGVAQPSGTIDLRLDSFSGAPAGPGTPQPSFAAVVGLGAVRLKANKMLGELLDLAGLSRKGLRFQEKEMSCEGKNGRIACAPVHLLAGKAEIEVSGEMGLDGSLNCRLKLPVSERMAAQALPGVPLLPGETIEAVINGTRTAPVFDSQALFVRLREQLVKAAAAPPGSPVVPVERPKPVPAEPGPENGSTQEPAPAR